MKLCIFFLLVLIMGCVNKKKKTNTKIIHPTEENINPSNVSYKIDNTSLNEIDRKTITEIKNKINNYKKEFTIGKEQGKDYEMFGNIEDALIDSDHSQIYILDTQNGGINLFDLNGKFKEKVSRKGKGPEELIYPAAIKKLNNKLFVLNGKANIKTFNYNDSTLVYDKTIVSQFPEAFCLSNDYLYTKNMTVTGPSSKDNKHPIFQYNLNNYDTPVNKFGKLYNAKFWGAVVQMSSGGIECAPESNRVVQFFSYLNTIYAYDATGKLKWATQIDDFDFIKLTEQAGKIGPDRKNLPMTFNYIENVISLNNNYFFAQIANRTISRKGYFLNSIDTYLINYKNGRGTLISKNLPIILSITQKRIAFLLEEKKYPQIEVATY